MLESFGRSCALSLYYVLLKLPVGRTTRPWNTKTERPPLSWHVSLTADANIDYKPQCEICNSHDMAMTLALGGFAASKFGFDSRYS